MDLALRTDWHQDCAVVHLEGEVDLESAPKLREFLIGLISDGATNMVLNMQGLRFIDSTGIGVLIGALKRIRAEGGSLRLTCAPDNVLQLFRITGLHRVFPMYGSESDAILGTSLGEL